MRTLTFRSLAVLLALAFCFTVANPFIQPAEAGWWACVKATAKCAGATAAASTKCAAAAAAVSDVGLWAICAAALVAAADQCEKVAQECGL